MYRSPSRQTRYLRPTDPGALRGHEHDRGVKGERRTTLNREYPARRPARAIDIYSIDFCSPHFQHFQHFQHFHHFQLDTKSSYAVAAATTEDLFHVRVAYDTPTFGLRVR